MELLVIKNGTDYIRIKEDAFLAVGLDRASVFPFDQLDRVSQMQRDAREQGFPEAAIFRLTLTETPL